MCQAALQEIFRSIVVARLIYASSAWTGFVTETDRKRVDAFLNRSKKRRHNITLPEMKGHLAAKNFIIRLLYKDTY